MTVYDAAGMLMVDDILTNVSTHFGVKYPGVRYIQHHYVGWYKPMDAEITLPRSTDPEHLKYVVVHEMAHHVDCCLNPDRAGRKPHDKTFFWILVDLVRLCYTDPSDYPWGSEYTRIQWWAILYGYAWS